MVSVARGFNGAHISNGVAVNDARTDEPCELAVANRHLFYCLLGCYPFVYLSFVRCLDERV